MKFVAATGAAASWSRRSQPRRTAALCTASTTAFALRPDKSSQSVRAHTSDASRPAADASGGAEVCDCTDLSGRWIKDKSASDSMEEAIRAMALGTLMRQAVRLVRGMVIKHTAESFTMSVFSVISWFKVTETYRFGGHVSECRRRDFRKGKHRGTVSTAAGGVALHVEWGAPHAGSLCDTYTLAAPDVLHVDTDMVVNGARIKYRSVFNRKK